MSAFTTVKVKKSKTKTKWLIREKFNLSAAEAEVKFRNIRTVYELRLKTLPTGAGRDAMPMTSLELNLLPAKFPPRHPPCCSLRFSASATCVQFGSYVVSQDTYWFETIYGKCLHKRTNQRSNHYVRRGGHQ